MGTGGTAAIVRLGWAGVNGGLFGAFCIDFSL